MKLIFFTTILLTLWIQSSSLDPYKDSDFIIGSPVQGDTLLDALWNSQPGSAGVLQVDRLNKTYLSFYRITYIRTLEYGFNPNARVKLESGGPGFNYCLLALNSTVVGGGFQYTVEIYGRST